jgi:hypothetical protein
VLAQRAQLLRTLQTKTTKKALEDQRIATDKVASGSSQAGDLKRTGLTSEDSHLPRLVVMENGRRVVKPMRY